jgi:hypothetical protein
MSYDDQDDPNQWHRYPIDPYRSGDDETNPNVPLFNWEEIDLAKPVPSEPKPAGKTFSVKLDMSWYADQDPGPRLAAQHAIDKFLDISKADRKQVSYTAIKKEEEVALFSHVKKTYTIEVTAAKEAIKQYLKNKKNYVGIK